MDSLTGLRKGKFSLFTVVGVIVFAVYCLFVFLVFKRETVVFWMSFGFMLAAFAAQFVGPGFVGKNPDVEAVFFGIPVVYLGVFYFFAELFASLVFMTFQHVNWKAALLVQVILFAAYLVCAAVSVVTQQSVKEMSEDRRNEAVVFKAQFVDILGLIDECIRIAVDPELTKSLEHLSETIRYSDPFGRREPIVQEVEARISQKTSELQLLCNAGSFDDAKRTVAELENMYMERRRKLLLVK